MHSFRRDLTLLRDHRFALLFLARTTSVLGGSFAPVALAFGVLGLPGADATTLSVVLTAEALPLVAFLLVGGVIADRLPRQRVMMAGESLNAVAFASLATMLLTGWTPLPAMSVAAAFTGIGMAILFPALAGIVPEIVPADRLQTANGLLGLGANSARIAGLLLSGAAVVMLGGGWSLLVSAVLFATAGSIVAAIRVTRAERDAATSHSVLADLRVGWREFISRQWLWVTVAQFSILVMALQAAHGVLGPVVAKRYLGGAPAWSAVLAGEAVGTIVGVLIALRLRPRRPLLLATLVTFPTATPYLLLGLGTPLWTIVSGAFLMGVSFDIFGVMWNTTMQREIPPEALSRVSSYDALGSLMFGPIGLLLAGPATVVVGPRPALVGCAAMIVVTTLGALLSPAVRRLRAPEPVPTVVPVDALTATP